MASQRTLIPKWEPPSKTIVDLPIKRSLKPDEVVMLALWRNGGSTKRTARELGMTRPDIRLIRRRAYEQMGVKTAHEYWREKGLDPVSDSWRWRKHT